jgi:polygalacturonase
MADEEKEKEYVGTSIQKGKRNMRAIRTPLFMLLLSCTCIALPRGRTVCIVDGGAVGDGKTLNTAIIQKIIDSVASVGGTVVVPPGVFLTGTLHLRSDINLHIERGGVLKGTERLEEYQHRGRRVGLLFTEDARNVSISGEGTIDGNGDSFMDLAKAKNLENAGTAWTRQREHFREVKEGVGDGPAVPRDRPYQTIIFSGCAGVTVRGVTITNSPFWTVHFADCDGVIISGVRIWCNLLVPNNDGVDFTSCSNVVMSDCDIRTGDDCIVITGYSHHFDLPGFRDLKRPCENIAVSNCLLVSRSAAIRIGGFDQNPMRNMTFSNITITNSNRGIGLFVRDQGGIENVVFTNIVIETRLHTGDWWGNGEPIHLSAVRLTKDVPLGRIRSVKFQNIVCRGESGMLLYGSDESVIEDVSFDNVTFHVVESPLNGVAGGNFDLRPVLEPRLQLFSHDIPALYARHVRNLRIRGFDLRWDAVKSPFFTHGIEVEEFEGLWIGAFDGTGAPGNRAAFPLALRNGRGCDVTLPAASVRRENVKESR